MSQFNEHPQGSLASNLSSLVPPEVLAQVLRYHFQTPLFARSSNHYAPVHVCRFWREVALNDPKSWSSTELYIDFKALASSLPVTDDLTTVDPKPTIARILSELRWRLLRVKGMPVDLSITFEETGIDQNFDFRYVQCDLIVEMIRERLKWIFASGNSSTRVRLGSYQERGLHIYHGTQYSFFNEILSMALPEQFESLTQLTILYPDIEHPMLFPNLQSLTIGGDTSVLGTLSQFSCPTLLNLSLPGCEDDEQFELYLAPLLKRYGRLKQLTASGHIFSSILPPRGPDCWEHPSLTSLEVIVEETWWQLFPFLRAFPKLQTIRIIGRGLGLDDEGGSMVVAMNVVHLHLSPNINPILARQVLNAFPNLRTLELGSIQEGSVEPLVDAVEMFRLLDQIEDDYEYVVPTFWPRLCEVSFSSLVLDKVILVTLMHTLCTRYLEDTDGPSVATISGRVASQCKVVVRNCYMQWEANTPPCRLPDSKGSYWHLLRGASRSLTASAGLSFAETTHLFSVLLQTRDME